MQHRLLGAAIAAALSSCLVAQSPCFDVNLGVDLNLFDDDTSAPQPLGFTFVYNGVSYTDVQVCSNGYIWFGTNPQLGGDYTPTDGELLTDQPRIAPFWCDLNPGDPASGNVYYDASTPGVARITWAGVFAFGTNHANFIQVTLDASNSVTVMYGANTEVGTTNTQAIIGASPGINATANPITLATRPFLSTSNTWHETIVIGPGTSMPYSGIKMLWTPTNPGVVVTDVTCTPNTLPGPASYDLVGQGCPGRSGPSLYEVFDTFGGNPPDLSGLNLSFVPASATDFIALPGISPTWFAGFTNNLSMTDDQSIPITLPFAFPYGGSTVSQIYVSSNGFVTLGSTDPGSGCCFGDPFAMVQGPPRISGFWADLYPPGGGGVYADLDTGTGDFVVTWAGVPEFFAGPLQTFQIALSPSGLFTIRWQTVADQGHTWVSGFSAGGGSADPGPVDLSAVNGAVVSTVVTVPLEIDVLNGSAPAIGTTFTIDANNIQSLPNGVFCILLISTEIPGGIPLDGLGLTGCTAYVALPELLSFFNLTLGSPTTSFAIAIPQNNAFLGTSLMSQAISDDLTANAFGYRVSNGLRWNIGL